MFEDIMIADILNLMKTINPQIQEGPRTLCLKKIALNHTITLLKTVIKRSFKAAREKYIAHGGIRDYCSSLVRSNVTAPLKHLRKVEVDYASRHMEGRRVPNQT